MKTATFGEENQANITEETNFNFETSFVLFFLAIEFGQSTGALQIDTVFLAITLLMVAILPYFLISDDKLGFGNWFFGRSLIIGFAFTLGIIFKQSVGVVLPETFRFLPMTLLIVSAMISCYAMFYGFIKLRLAK